MSQITFDQLKKKCIREFCSNNFRTNGFPSGASMPGAMAIAQLIELKQTGKFPNHRKFAEQLENECVKAIEAVDIRNIKPLIELCPDSVPAWIKKGSYFVDSDGWVFVRLYGQKNLRYGEF
jgi:hypothetical protein